MKQPEDKVTLDMFEPVKEILEISEQFLLNQPKESNAQPPILYIPVSTDSQ